MELTVLGSSAVRPSPGRACAGYLLESGPLKVLLDCGPGVFANLVRFVHPGSLDAIVISHAHPDHMLDLVIARQAMMYSPDGLPDKPVRTYVGPGTSRFYADLGRLFQGDSGDEDYWLPALRIDVFDPEAGLDIGDLRLSFAPTRHVVPCWAMRIEHQGKALVYTGDTGPSEAVTELAQGAGLLLAEATLPEREGHESERYHLTPAEAGRMAARAKVDRLVLTHYFEQHGPERLRARAEKAYPERVTMAQEGERYAVE